MHVISARNVHQILPEGLYQLNLHGVHRDTRNGPALEFEAPVTSIYLRPNERVVFWPERDCNPFFHFMESLWMLSGRNDVEFVSEYASNMKNYSDDGQTFHGAYGYRWINHFDFNQLDEIVRALRENTADRRCYLQIWDAKADLGRHGRDFPCNLGVLFRVLSNGNLDMTVFNRSNDMIWGAYGANAVHFSMLHEYIARRIGQPLGVYRQVSGNMHGYLETLKKVGSLADVAQESAIGTKAMLWDPYTTGEVKPYPIFNLGHGCWPEWHDELEMFLDETTTSFSEPLFHRVGMPMRDAWRAYKNTEDPQRFVKAKIAAGQILASDWRLACLQWLERREAKFLASQALVRAQDDGVNYEEKEQPNATNE